VTSDHLTILQGFNELEKLLKEASICVATTEKLLKDSGVAKQASYDTIVDRLKLKSNARGMESGNIPNT